MKELERFREVVDDRHEYARQWKEKTKSKVFGGFSCYVPEEIIWAAGFLPVRVMASRDVKLNVTLPFMLTTWCPYSRGCLAEAVEGRYNYLDGVVLGHECMHMQVAFYGWRSHAPVSFGYDIYVPRHLQSRFAKDCVKGELEYFKRALEEWRGMPISRYALLEAIEVYNTNRRLLRELYGLMKSDNPPISGVELMEATMASQYMDKQEHNALLQAALKGLAKRRGKSEPGARLMIIGPEFDDREFVKLVESLGGRIVLDDLDTGSRYFWNDTVLVEDPLAALADRYVDKSPCPMKDLIERRRFKQILKLAKEWRVQGALLIQRRFCDPHAYDTPNLGSFLKENGIPSMVIECGLTVPEQKVRTDLGDFIKSIPEKAK